MVLPLPLPHRSLVWKPSPGSAGCCCCRPADGAAPPVAPQISSVEAESRIRRVLLLSARSALKWRGGLKGLALYSALLLQVRGCTGLCISVPDASTVVTDQVTCPFVVPMHPLYLRCPFQLHSRASFTNCRACCTT